MKKMFNNLNEAITYFKQKGDNLQEWLEENSKHPEQLHNEYYEVVEYFTELKYLRGDVKALKHAFDKLQPCCPKENEECIKTGCFINGGYCFLKTKRLKEIEEERNDKQRS